MKKIIKYIKYHKIFNYPFKNELVIYSSIRDDLYNLILEKPNVVLDIGCGNGKSGEWLKKKYKCKVYGIEIDSYHFSKAKEKLDDVFNINLNKLKIEEIKYLKKIRPDLIVFADVLEHLYDPWNILKSIIKICDKNTSVLISLPNIRHYSFILSILIFGIFPYRDRGINDFTHLRYFTIKNIKDMVEYANLKIIKIRRNYRIIEANIKFNKYSVFIKYIPFIRDFFTFQYLLLAKKK